MPRRKKHELQHIFRGRYPEHQECGVCLKPKRYKKGMLDKLHKKLLDMNENDAWFIPAK